MEASMRPVLSTLLVLAMAPIMHATGTWNGQNTLHVPVSWCIVQGSPAQASPNVAGDTTTDDLIWRRHARPTDNIYVNVSGITFRSAIDNGNERGTTALMGAGAIEMLAR